MSVGMFSLCRRKTNEHRLAYMTGKLGMALRHKADTHTQNTVESYFVCILCTKQKTKVNPKIGIEPDYIFGQKKSKEQTYKALVCVFFLVDKVIFKCFNNVK